ncbi:MAG TPA: hypothetical protein VJ840_18570 [Gemmatimonadaceae bacterium]|nr:hypothetical protein [Gemmatimonadaceae bacterium]
MALFDDSTSYGNVFGGAGNSLLAPFIGQEGMDAARANSLMNIGAAMAQASAPSYDPSHKSFGAALGAGLNAGQNAYQQGMQRGLQNAGAAMSLQQNKMLYDLVRQSMGGTPAAATPADGTTAPGAPQPMPAYSPTAAMPGGGSPTIGAGGSAASPAAALATGAAPVPAGGPLSAGGSLNPLGMPMPLAAMGLLGDRAKYLEAQMGAYAPTDLIKTMRAAGVDPSSETGQKMLNAEIARTTAPQATRLANGGYLLNGEYHATPNAEGMIPEQDANGNWTMRLVPGAAQAMTERSVANAAGPATFKTVPTYNPQTRMTYNTPQTVNAQAAGAYTPAGPAGSLAPQPGIPAPLRNNNPGAMMVPGATNQLQSFPSMAAGVAAMDKQLQTYSTRDGLNTISGIVNKWSPGAGKGNSAEGTAAYVADVAAQLQIPPDAPLNMNDAATRQALARAMANHENGRAALAASGAYPANAPVPGVAPRGGPLPATPPLGETQRTQEAQTAAATNMQKDMKDMNDFRAAAPSQLDALNRMMQIAQHKTIFSSGIGDTELFQDNPLGGQSAAEYEKQRSQYLAKAGAVGTDAQRTTQGHALPDYGKPREALVEGIQTQINNVQQGMLRSNYLTPFGNKGDTDAYTTAANGFDQHIRPSMMPVLSRSGTPEAKAAYRAAVAKDPSLKANFQWALDNGLLK